MVGRTRRVTLREAADILGISKDAVRKRINRGTLPSDVGEDGRRYVYLDDVGDAGGDAGSDVGEGARENSQNFGEFTGHRDALIEELRDEVEAWREESRRKDAILAQLSQANAEQARTIRALEAPRAEQDKAEGTESRSDRGTPSEATQEQERPTGKPLRGLLRRIFG